MRSAILVDAVLNFEVVGEHIHITDEGGSIHLALTRSVFFANISRARAVAAIIQATEQCNIIALERAAPDH